MQFEDVAQTLCRTGVRRSQMIVRLAALQPSLSSCFTEGLSSCFTEGLSSRFTEGLSSRFTEDVRDSSGLMKRRPSE
jgi:hypothetical protein